MSEWATPQEDDPPEVRLVIKATLDLVDMVEHPDRPNADIIRSVDALGRALARLKAYLRSTSP